VRLLVIGAGGHAKVVIDAARRAGLEIAGVLGNEGDPAELLGLPVTHDAADVHADGFIVAIGDNAARARAFDAHRERGLSPASVVHPSAVIADGASIGEGAFVAAGVIVNVDARIGANSILNTGCTVDHDCVVGDHALIGPTASLCGGVEIGQGVLLGAGSSVTPRARIGAWSVVGAGAAVVSDLPAHSVCVGVPARAVRVVERGDAR
jgi:sugar O-acyltransferase (sialic acid O-acetyltransferase NeuD family)